MGGWSAILSQLPSGTASSSSSSSSGPANVTVTVSPEGITPATINAKTGDTVTMVNNDTVPHIFESQTLRDGSGNVLLTPSIFAGDSASFTIFKNEVAGQHAVYSQMTPALALSIFLSVPAATEQSDSNFGGPLNDIPLPGETDRGTTGSSASSVSSVQSSATSSAPAASSSRSVSSSSLSSTKTQATNDPTGTTELIAVTEKSTELPNNAKTVSDSMETLQKHSSSSAASTLHAGAPKPPSQPASGMESWMALGGSIGGLLVISRKKLKAFTAL